MEHQTVRRRPPPYLQGCNGACYLFFLGFSLLFLFSAFAVWDGAFWGMLKICCSLQSLTVDSCMVGGLSGALFNCGMLGLVGTAILLLGRVEPDGTVVGAFLLFTVFGLFGKNCLNIWPAALGVWLYSRVKGEPFHFYAAYALLSGAIAPVVSELLFAGYFECHWAWRIILALAVGVLLGFFLPPLSAHALTMHKGHNLFNVGLSAGLLAILFYAVYTNLVLRPFGLIFASNYIVGEGYPEFFHIFVAATALSCFAAGLLLNKGVKGLWKLLKSDGYCRDCLAEFGLGCVLMNFAMLVAMALAYYWIIGAKFTGPAVCSLFCMAVWAGRGANVRNVLPIVLGYCVTSLISKTPLSLPAWVVGVCFASGMAPLSGRWGPHWGLLAGALHAALVLNTASFHGGFNLYNGGFTASLVAMALVPLIEAVFKEIEHYKRRHNAGKRLHRAIGKASRLEEKRSGEQDI